MCRAQLVERAPPSFVGSLTADWISLLVRLGSGLPPGVSAAGICNTVFLRSPRRNRDTPLKVCSDRGALQDMHARPVRLLVCPCDPSVSGAVCSVDMAPHSSRSVCAPHALACPLCAACPWCVLRFMPQSCCVCAFIYPWIVSRFRAGPRGLVTLRRGRMLGK